jgi:hypothetical protein
VEQNRAKDSFRSLDFPVTSAQQVYDRVKGWALGKKHSFTKVQKQHVDVD